MTDIKSPQLLAKDFPPAQRVDRIVLGSGSVVIACAGFEPRARRFKELLSQRYRPTVILLDYRPEMKENRFGELKRELENSGSTVLPIIYDRYAPGGFDGVLSQVLRDLGATRVLVDMSALSKLALFLCLLACLDLNLPVDMLYTEAEEYAPSREVFEESFLENALHLPSIHAYTGVMGTVRIPRLASVGMQGQPLAAIVFMSFNEQLTQALIDTVYPSRLLLVNGRPPRLSWREEATYRIHERLLGEWPDEDNPRGGNGLPLRACSTLDYRESIDLLLELYWDLATQYRVMLSPTGSKMQALGAFFAWAIHPDIHVEYPTPRGFLHRFYSDGVGQSWLIRLPALREFVNCQSRIDRARILGIMNSKWSD